MKNWSNSEWDGRFSANPSSTRASDGHAAQLSFTKISCAKEVVLGSKFAVVGCRMLCYLAGCGFPSVHLKRSAALRVAPRRSCFAC